MVSWLIVAGVWVLAGAAACGIVALMGYLFERSPFLGVLALFSPFIAVLSWLMHMIVQAQIVK